MKRLIGVILCISVLMIACNKKNQQVLTETNTQEDFPKIMFVNAADGLRVRNSPSSDGEKIGLLSYLSWVRITKEDNNTVNIGGVDGKYVYITYPKEGWIFNGFLEDEEHHKKRLAAIETSEGQIKEKIIGDWTIIEITPYTEEYENTISYKERQLSFSDRLYDFFGWYGGYDWESGTNTIKLNPESRNMVDYYFSDIKFIDDDHMTLYDEMLNGIKHADLNKRKKLFLKLERVK
jgi:hypothetical protein